MKPEKTRFTENLVRANGLDFRKWIFRPGMRFGSREKWWAEGLPPRAGGWHNGLDLALYESGGGRTEALPEGTKIPLLYPGRIVKIMPDFLGESIFVENEARPAAAKTKKRFFTVYGHLSPEPGIEGRRLEEGLVIGRTARLTKSPVPAHLHISVLLLPQEVPDERLDWKVLDETDGVEFLDPEGVL